jgi:hypothetical protein
LDFFSPSSLSDSDLSSLSLPAAAFFFSALFLFSLLLRLASSFSFSLFCLFRRSRSIFLSFSFFLALIRLSSAPELSPSLLSSLPESSRPLLPLLLFFPLEVDLDLDLEAEEMEGSKEAMWEEAGRAWISPSKTRTSRRAVMWDSSRTVEVMLALRIQVTI